MAYSTIPKGSLFMNTVLYTGNGAASRNITGVGFQPDWVWGKCRNTTVSHALYDVVRGSSKILNSNTTSAEGTNAALNAFVSDGFTVNSDSYLNGNSNTYVAWNWKAGTSVSGTTTGSGTGTSYTGSVNTTSGFSIIKYIGNGTSGHTIPHNLGIAPKMFIVKSTTIADDGWYVYNKAYDTSNNKYQRLEQAGGLGSGSAFWNDTAPTTSTISLGNSGGVNSNGQTYIAYIFADIKGFSKMGSYSGNSSADGTFVYTGFSPAFVMFKASASSESWQIYDIERTPNNALGEYLNPNNNSAAGNNLNFVDYLSNGFKLRSADGGVNSGQLYTYMAFASNPFVATSGSDAIPVTAR